MLSGLRARPLEKTPPALRTAGPLGQCRLVKSGANLLLSRFQGLALTINGLAQIIPAAGVALAPTGLTPNTLYYIYACMGASGMMLEASTTGRTTDALTGVEVKAGDASRTLVGMALPIAGPVWSDALNLRLVSSYFNRRSIQIQAGLGSSVGTTSSAASELSTSLRISFLHWSDEAAAFTFDGYAQNSSAGATVASYLAVDGTVLDGYSVFLNTGAAQIAPVSVTSTIGAANGLAEGLHYITPFVSVNAGTGTWVGSASAGTRCSVKGLVRG